MPFPPPRRRNFRLFWCYECRRTVSILPSPSAAFDLFCPRCVGPFVQNLGIRSLPLPPPPPPPPPTFHFIYPSLPPPPPPPPLPGDYYTGPNLSQLVEQLTENDRAGPPPASEYSIETLPTVAITADHLRGGSECPVCKEEFAVGEAAREMPCRHVYHSDCILPWLRMHNSCPVCRCRISGEEPAAVEERSEGARSGGGGNGRRLRREMPESWNPFMMLSAFRGVDRRERRDRYPLDSPAGMSPCSVFSVNEEE